MIYNHYIKVILYIYISCIEYIYVYIYIYINKYVYIYHIINSDSEIMNSTINQWGLNMKDGWDSS